MALHKDFPESPYAILDPDVRWFPADEALRESSAQKPMLPLVPQLRKNVKEWHDNGYVGAARHEQETAQLVVQHPAPAPPGRRHHDRISGTTSPSASHWKRSSICRTWWSCRINST